MAGSLVTNYLAQGTAAARPATPTAATGTLSFYFASDTETLSIYDWNDGAWQDLPTSGGLAAATTTEILTGTSTTVAGTPDAIAALWEQGSDIASAGTISVGEGGYFHVTGTTTITDIDFGTTKAGRTAILVFDGALTLTHNATTLILPTGANITAAAGDSCVVVSEGGDNVRVVHYQRKDGTALVGGAGSAGVTMPQGRLTLTAATPVLTSDVTAAGTIFYALFNGAYVPIWNGSSTTMTLVTELSQALSDATKSPAAAANNSNYDMFVWNDGGTKRCTRGPAWTSDTARGTGAGTTQITRNADGYYTNTVAITNGPGAGLGTYVGTVRTNGSATVDMIFGGAGAAGGESCIIGVWNAYNRVMQRMLNFDNSNSWTSTSTSYLRKNANANNDSRMVIGLDAEAVTGVHPSISSNSGNNDRRVAWGLDSATVAHVGSPIGFTQNITSNLAAVAQISVAPGIGFHTLSPLELTAGGTATWLGDNGSITLYTGTIVNVWA